MISITVCGYTKRLESFGLLWFDYVDRLVGR